MGAWYVTNCRSCSWLPLPKTTASMGKATKMDSTPGLVRCDVVLFRLLPCPQKCLPEALTSLSPSLAHSRARVHQLAVPLQRWLQKSLEFGRRSSSRYQETVARPGLLLETLALCPVLKRHAVAKPSRPITSELAYRQASMSSSFIPGAGTGSMPFTCKDCQRLWICHSCASLISQRINRSVALREEGGIDYVQSRQKPAAQARKLTRLLSRVRDRLTRRYHSSVNLTSASDMVASIFLTHFYPPGFLNRFGGSWSLPLAHRCV